jgi:hypothetical protein
MTLCSKLAIALALVVGAAGCRGESAPTVHFPHSTDPILNPERGFFIDVDLVAGRDFSYVRDQGYTLAYAVVRLDAYRFEALSPLLLDALGEGLEAARDAGIKVILRFVYNHAADGEDAPKWAVLAHLEQLTPVLQANADVIAVMDAGFIGAWGEWHSSVHGLDNQHDRGDILWAILTALPASRSTMLRSPIYKALAYGGRMSPAHAFDGSHPSRIGHLNSCFLASETDLGTYTDPIDTWKQFIAEEGRFTPVGGETCQPNPPRTDCPTATAELARLRWSFLNAQYHDAVLATWRAQGCYQEIAQRLGYRLELRSATFEPRVAPGDDLAVTIRLENTGYAAMFNARPVYLTLGEWTAEVAVDPRRWEPGQDVRFTARIRVPADARPGRYRLGLWLPDADERLRAPGRVERYSVRFANARWDAPINVLSDDVIVAAPQRIQE